jgi:hypothetical protein
LAISYLCVETRWKPYEYNTCSNDESTRFNKIVSIINEYLHKHTNIKFNEYLYKQRHGSHINTLKNDKINDSFNTIYF